MRDVNRIDTFCAELARYWKRVPDWRFGQFMMNFLSFVASSGRDPFFPEEEEMLHFLDQYFQTIYN